jgi:hypothetical protein
LATNHTQPAPEGKKLPAQSAFHHAGAGARWTQINAQLAAPVPIIQRPHQFKESAALLNTGKCSNIVHSVCASAAISRKLGGFSIFMHTDAEAIGISNKGHRHAKESFDVGCS